MVTGIGPAVRMTTKFKHGRASGERARETFIENHLGADTSYTSHHVEEQQSDGTWATVQDHIKRAPAKRRGGQSDNDDERHAKQLPTT